MVIFNLILSRSDVISRLVLLMDMCWKCRRGDADRASAAYWRCEGEDTGCSPQWRADPAVSQRQPEGLGRIVRYEMAVGSVKNVTWQCLWKRVCQHVQLQVIAAQRLMRGMQMWYQTCHVMLEGQCQSKCSAKNAKYWGYYALQMMSGRGSMCTFQTHLRMCTRWLWNMM